MRKNRSASGCAAFAARYCRITGVTFFLAGLSTRAAVAPMPRGGQLEEVARDGRGADVDGGDALMAAVDDCEQLAERRNDRDRDGRHQRRRVRREHDEERLELSRRS